MLKSEYDALLKDRNNLYWEYSLMKEALLRAEFVIKNPDYDRSYALSAIEFVAEHERRKDEREK